MKSQQECEEDEAEDYGEGDEMQDADEEVETSAAAALHTSGKSGETPVPTGTDAATLATPGEQAAGATGAAASPAATQTPPTSAQGAPGESAAAGTHRAPREPPADEYVLLPIPTANKRTQTSFSQEQPEIAPGKAAEWTLTDCRLRGTPIPTVNSWDEADRAAADYRLIERIGWGSLPPAMLESDGFAALRPVLATHHGQFLEVKSRLEQLGIRFRASCEGTGLISALRAVQPTSLRPGLPFTDSNLQRELDKAIKSEKGLRCVIEQRMLRTLRHDATLFPGVSRNSVAVGAFLNSADGRRAFYEQPCFGGTLAHAINTCTSLTTRVAVVTVDLGYDGEATLSLPVHALTELAPRVCVVRVRYDRPGADDGHVRRDSVWLGALMGTSGASAIRRGAADGRAPYAGAAPARARMGYAPFQPTPTPLAHSCEPTTAAAVAAPAAAAAGDDGGGDADDDGATAYASADDGGAGDGGAGDGETDGDAEPGELRAEPALPNRAQQHSRPRDPGVRLDSTGRHSASAGRSGRGGRSGRSGRGGRGERGNRSGHQPEHSAERVIVYCSGGGGGGSRGGRGGGRSRHGGRHGGYQRGSTSELRGPAVKRARAHSSAPRDRSTDHGDQPRRRTIWYNGGGVVDE